MKHFNQKPVSVYKLVCDSYILNVQILGMLKRQVQLVSHNIQEIER